MTDRYSEGYARAEKVYRQRFNFRYEILRDTKNIWEKPEMSRANRGLRKLWPELAEQLDAISDQADKMPGEYR